MILIDISTIDDSPHEVTFNPTCLAVFAITTILLTCTSENQFQK